MFPASRVVQCAPKYLYSMLLYSIVTKCHLSTDPLKYNSSQDIYTSQSTPQQSLAAKNQTYPCKTVIWKYGPLEAHHEVACDLQHFGDYVMWSMSVPAESRTCFAMALRGVNLCPLFWHSGTKFKSGGLLPLLSCFNNNIAKQSTLWLKWHFKVPVNSKKSLFLAPCLEDVRARDKHHSLFVRKWVQKRLFCK